MTNKMLKFTDLQQETPEKRLTKKRKQDFQEIYNEYINDKAKEQSSRCSQCGVPFCQIHCPLSNNIPDLKRHINFHKAQTICLRFAEEFARKIDYVKAIV